MKSTISFLFVFFLFANCIQSSKFDLTKWKTKEDGIYIYRYEMANDLLKNHQLVGLNYNQVVELLGIPQFEDTAKLSYEILMDYGRDIDPIHTKFLTLSMTKDSIVSSFAIDEWRK